MSTVTKSFSGKPARALRNRYVEEMRPHEDALPDFPLTYFMNKDLRAAATKAGRGEFLAFWSGQAVGLNRNLPAADLVAQIAQEATHALDKYRG